MFQATARTYRIGRGEEEDRFQCPSCGRKQNIFGKFHRGDDGAYRQRTKCYNCEKDVLVTYRRMFRRNY